MRSIFKTLIGAVLFALLLLTYKNLLFQIDHPHMPAKFIDLPAYVILAICDLLFKTAFIITILKFILPSFTKEKKVVKLYVLFTAVLLFFFVSEVLTKGWLLPGFHFMHLWGHIPVGIFSLVIYILLASILIIDYLIKQWIHNEKQKRALIESQLTNELNFLKAQINPHFIFNSLNALFSISQKYHAAELENGILKLSGLMRYSLYENNNQLVTIEKEIQYIKDYIGLFKLRYPGDELTVKFDVGGNTDTQIAPMIFLPFIENAFKYGVSLQKRSVIEISIEADGAAVLFKCTNEIVRQNEEEIITDKGLGLVNVKRRLELLYPDKHKLLINEEENKFIVKLQINSGA